MANISFQEIVQAARQLSPEQQAMLVLSLQLDAPEEEFTREQAIAELNALRAAGAFENVESLYGKYANPNVPDVSDEELTAYLREVGKAWEEDLNELDANG